MTNEARPRPWRAEPSGRVGADCIFDANGAYVCWVAKCDSEIIVNAVNLHKWLIEHNKLNAEKVCELIAERDKLRETLREVVRTCEHALGYTNAPGGQAAFCQVAPSDLRNILSLCLSEPGGEGLAPAASAAGKEGV